MNERIDRLVKHIKLTLAHWKYNKAAEQEKEDEIDDLIRDTRKSMYVLRESLVKLYGHK